MMTKNNNMEKFNIILSILYKLVSKEAYVRKYDKTVN